MKHLFKLIVFLFKFICQVLNYFFISIFFIITDICIFIYHFNFNYCYSFATFRVAFKKLLKDINKALND